MAILLVQDGGGRERVCIQEAALQGRFLLAPTISCWFTWGAAALYLALSYDFNYSSSRTHTHTYTHGCLWEMERHNTENLIVSADRAEQGNEPEIGLGLTEKCAVVSARERTWGFARVKKKKTRSEGTWPWMSETDVINQKTFLGNYFPFHHTPQSLLIYHTSRPCATLRVYARVCRQTAHDCTLNICICKEHIWWGRWCVSEMDAAAPYTELCLRWACGNPKLHPSQANKKKKKGKKRKGHKKDLEPCHQQWHCGKASIVQKTSRASISLLYRRY